MTASSSTRGGRTAASTNQSWKDSGDSQRFHDGRFADAPIAPVEVQGYVYDAKLGLAEIARDVWREPELAERLEREAAELRAAFDKAFWVEERGRFLRARAGRGEEARRRALLEYGASALERDRPPRARRAGRRPAPLRVALVGLGDPHDGERRGRVQPDQLPQRHGLASRHVAHRLGARAARLPRGRAGASRAR